jgi:hypothetical protein
MIIGKNTYKIVLKDSGEIVSVKADAYGTGQQVPMLFFYNYLEEEEKKDKNEMKQNGKSAPKNIVDVSKDEDEEDKAEIVATVHAGEWLYVKKVS